MPQYDDVLEIEGRCRIKSTNQDGTCMARDKCKIIESNSDNYQICGSNCCKDFICCPDPDYEKLTISEQACAKLRNSPYSRIQNVILNYNNTQKCNNTIRSNTELVASNEFPHMAILGYETINKTTVWQCGGTLISDQFILTAATCLNSEYGQVKFVRLGSMDIKNNETNNCRENYDIIKRISHPDYNPISKFNNIAIIKLLNNVLLTPNIRPACLSDSDDITTKDTIFAIGYQNSTLSRVNLISSSYEKCKALLEENMNETFLDGYSDEIQFCAESQTKTQDSCTRLPGCSIQIQHSKYYNMIKVVGVSSYEQSCKFPNSTGVYTRIYPYLKWIEKVVWTEVVLV